MPKVGNLQAKVAIESYEPPSGSKWSEALLGGRSREYTPYGLNEIYTLSLGFRVLKGSI